jgi:hypothetical protein
MFVASAGVFRRNVCGACHVPLTRDSDRSPNALGGERTPFNRAVKSLLEELRRMPNATPAEALAEFRRRLVELRLKAKRVHDARKP